MCTRKRFVERSLAAVRGRAVCSSARGDLPLGFSPLIRLAVREALLLNQNTYTKHRSNFLEDWSVHWSGNPTTLAQFQMEQKQEEMFQQRLAVLHKVYSLN